MRQISKGGEPPEFSIWKRGNPQGMYRDLTYVERQAIRQACIDEQLGLCCYCCRRITVDHSTNEHLKDLNHFPQHQLDYANIVASCEVKGRCNDARGSSAIGVSPLEPECETEVLYNLSGQIRGLTERAEITVSATNLKSLKEERKAMINALIWGGCENPDELDFLDPDLIDIFLEDLKAPKDNVLSSYSPVLVSILRSLKS